MSDIFNTIAHPTEGFYKDKGSRFLAFAYPLVSENQIDEIRADLRKRFHDARHHVYAFRFGAKGEFYRASDDGEPANSSGQPVLGVLRSYEITNVLTIVVRYFGGTKLGVPGLIKAYRSAAEDALFKAEIITQTVKQKFMLSFEYAKLSEILKLLKTDGADILEHNYEMTCNIICAVRERDSSLFYEKYSQISGLKTEKV